MVLAVQQQANERNDRYRVEVVFDVAGDEVFRAGQSTTIRFR